MPCETAEIAEEIGAFLARGTGPTAHLPKKKKFGTHFFAQSDLKKNLAHSHGRQLR